MTTLIALLALVWAGPVHASSSGISGRTNKDSGAGCGTCHSPSQSLGVSITGPATLAAGALGTYTINISGGTANSKMGVNIAGTGDQLSEVSSLLDKPNDDITHNSTDNNTNGSGAGTFTFRYTMPAGLAVGSTRTLYAAARVDGKWNHATNFVITVPKLNQTITFNAQTSPRTYVPGATFSVSPTASASSSLAITYTSDTPTICSMPGTTSTTVTMQGAGTCTIRANQAGNSTYNAATSVTRSITINKGNQSITFGSQVVAPSFSNGGTFNLSPAASASSGLAIQYSSITNSVCTKAASGTVVNMIAVGTCTIVAAQPGDVDWNAASSVQRSITISKGNQTISFPAQSNKAFVAGGTFSVSSVTASSGLAITYTSLTPAVCTMPGTTSATVTMVDNGTCTVEASQAGNTNFNPASDVNGNILLTETPLQPLITSAIIDGDGRATIPIGSNGNGPGVTYTATCTALGQTTRTGTTTTVYSPIVVLNLVNTVTYGCSVTASNSFGTSPPSSTSAVTPASTPLEAPTIRSSAPSAALYTFKVGESKTFVVVSTGRPIPGIARGGAALPSGMTYRVFNAISEPKIPLGVGWLGGIPAAGTVGATAITFTATNSRCGGALQPVCPIQNFTINIAKGDPTITFPAVPDRQFSTTPSYNLAATIATPDSTLSATNIVFTSSTPSVCTVSGTLLSTVGVGTCTINANSSTAAGYTASYNAAPQVSRSFAITQGSQTISFNAQPDRTYSPGGTFAISPVAMASSGLAISYASLSPSDCTVAGTTVTIVSGGICVIEASQDGNSLYLPATDVTQNILIGKAAQTITFGAQSGQAYVPGGSFALSPLATSTSGLAVDYTSTTPGVCTSVGTNVMIVAVGTCTISATQVGDQNYNAATPVNRNIGISAVPPGAPVLNETLASDSTIRLFFDAPANDGGAPITSYLGTCQPGKVQATSAESPVVVTGLTNNTLYTCSVAATNAQGEGAGSNTLQDTPVLRSGTALWTAACSACHGATPNAGRLNAAGSTGTVIDYVRSVQPDMLASGVVQALTANELSEIAKYIRDQLVPITANTAYVTPVQIDVGLPNHLYLGGVAFDEARVVMSPANGTLSGFTGTTITYTPNLGFTGMDSFTYRGRLGSPLVLGDTFTVTINVATPSAPVITSGNTANGVFGQAFSYQITATNSPASYGASPLGGGMSVNPATGLINGTLTAAGVFNVTISATNPGGTGMQGVQVTISPAGQTITFGAQPSPRSFGTNFAISPLATSTSGLTVTYSSLTADVCTVAGTTVTPVVAGVCTIAANQAGNSNYNAALQVTRTVTIGAIAPGAPTIGGAVGGVNQASISFTPPSDTGGSSITQYNATCNPGGFTGSNSASPIVVSGLTNNTQYTCSVTATNVAGTGPASGTVMVMPTAALVAPVITSAASTSFTVLSPGTFTVTATGNLAPVLSLVGVLPTGVTFTPGTGALAGTPATGTANSYPVTLTATNASGSVMQSFTLTVAKANQSINFANPGARNFSVTPFAISATATSGLAIAFTSNTPGVCTVAGSNVTTVATGVCSISADQPGNADYNAALQVTQGFSVNAGSQSITFNTQTPASRSFSTTPFSVNPVATASSGLAVSYSPTTPAVCTANGTSITTLMAGTCTIAANQAGNANFAAAPQVTQNVTVNAVIPVAPTIGTAAGSDQTATINFTPPASNGGATLSYTATCTAGGQTTRTGTGSASPIAVGSMVNGVAYSCSVTATNSAGTSPASGSVLVTPSSANGEALWNSVCANCHAAVPSGNQLNGAGSTATVLNHVRSLQPAMSGVPFPTGNSAAVQALTQSELAAIAAYINNNLTPNQVTTAASTPVQIDVSSHITFTNFAWSAFTSVEVVTPPANGMLSAFTGRTATYTPNPGFSGTDTFTYRGKRTSPNVDGDPVQVTVNVSAGAPTINSAASANGNFGQAFSYQITATDSPTSFGASGLPAGLSVDNVTGLISGNAGAGGTFNATVTATNAGGTGMAALTITIAPASQTITFNAQTPASQSFVPSGQFAVNPLASGGASGNPVTYSSTTTSVCTVSGSTVTMVFGGTCTIAANQAGNSNYTAAAQVTGSVTITPVVPGMPGIGAATPGNTQAQIAFSAPSSNGGSTIIDYTATCTASGQTTRTGTAGGSPITVTGLVNDVTYACTVAARNGAATNGGVGPASNPVNVTPATITVPGAPIIGIATAGDTSASLAFNPPLSNGGSAITNYTATCTAAGQTTRTGNGSVSPIAVSSMVNGVTYDCSITATNSAGTGAASSSVLVTPESAIALVSVVSRKTHGAAGPQSITIDLAQIVTGNVTVEPRAIGAGHQVVFLFDQAVTVAGSAAATDSGGMPIGSASAMASGNEVIVTLTGIANATRVTVTLTGVNGSVSAAASLGFLIGDVNESRTVTSADTSSVKSRAGHPVDGSNFRHDLNASGVIGAADVVATKLRVGTALP